MTTSVFNANQLSSAHKQLFIVGSLACLCLLGGGGLLFTWKYGPILSPMAFWPSVVWLMILVLIVWAVYCIRLGSRAESELSLSSRLNFKSGSTLVAVLFAACSTALLVLMAESIRAGGSSMIFVLVQFLLFLVFSAALALRFTELVPGLPPQAADQARANVSVLQARLDELEDLRNSPWLAEARGPTPKGRLRSSLAWWREELATTMPRSGLEMSQPFISYFLENVSRDTLFIKDLAATTAGVPEDSILEAEQRVIEGISRTGQIVRKLRAR